MQAEMTWGDTACRLAAELGQRDVLCGRIHTPQEDSVYALAGRQALA